MRLRISAVCLLVLVASVAASSTAGAANGADRANASRACSALRASVGAATFAQTFGAASSRSKAFGRCVSSMTRTAAQARSAAASACTGKKPFKRCVAAQVTSALNQQVATLKNAAMTCKSMRSSMGVAAFNQKFGKNANDRNAFGKCVSSQVSNGAQNRTQVFRASLDPLNGSGVSGSALLRLNGTTLTVRLDVRGLETNQSHLAHIHGFATDTKATCPGAAADTNGDKIISFTEGLASFGPVLVELANQQVGANGRLTVTKTITENVQSLLPLTNRAIVVHGLTVNGAYVPSLPVACGTITGG
jgi:hypothetical protein